MASAALSLSIFAVVYLYDKRLFKDILSFFVLALRIICFNVLPANVLAAVAAIYIYNNMKSCDEGLFLFGAFGVVDNIIKKKGFACSASKRLRDEIALPFVR